MFKNSTLNFFRKLTVLIIMTAGGLFSTNSIYAQNCNTDLTNGIAAGNITASSDNPPNEDKTKAFDNIRPTKWLTNAATGYLQVDLGTAKIVTNYSITSAIDVPGRDPKSFTLSGSNDGVGFTTLDTRTGETFASRSLTKYYGFTNSIAYRYYKLSITLNNGDVATQLAEIELLANNNCIVGKVYNNTVGVGYPSIPVLVRTTAGTVASTSTDASGSFAFTTASAPSADYAILIEPPASTYFSSGPSVNLNASVMSAQVYDYFQQEMWPTGSFLNVNGDIPGAIPHYYMIDNTEGAKTPASLDWVLKPSAISAPSCPVAVTTLYENGTFGNLSSARYISQHSWQPSFHIGPGTIPSGGEGHPYLFKPLITGTSGYMNGYKLYPDRAALYNEGLYNVTSFLGTLQDAVLIYGYTTTGTYANSTFSLLNGHNGGWRKTYGRTTGDPYDFFLAANGQTTAIGSIVEFTANIGTTGTKYLNFYGKNANSFAQIQSAAGYSGVELIFDVYNSSNVLVKSSTMFLSPVTSAAQDNPTSPWEGRTFAFTAASAGTYTFKLRVPTTTQLGNDFYLDNIQLSDCPIEYTLTGKVWNDVNGDAVQNNGEHGIPSISNSLFVNLVDVNGYILSTVTVKSDGTYSMPIPENVSDYKLVLTDNPSLNTPSLADSSGWNNTGENVNPQNSAVQSGIVGLIELNTATIDIVDQDFGINSLSEITIVPVTLESFTGVATDCNTATLKWKVSDAINFSRFEIERSSNGIDFSVAGFVNFNTANTRYQFSEDNLAKGYYHYRLKMADGDGHIKYSPVIIIRFDCSQQQALQVYPNPVKNKVIIKGLNNGEEIVIYNNSGKVIQNKKVIGSQLSIDMTAMTNGVYYIIGKNRNGVKVSESKIVKIH